jgi:hypothetical protein
MAKRNQDQNDDAATEQPGKPRSGPSGDATGGPNAHNMDPENMGEEESLVEDPPSETSTPPGPTSK